MSEGFYGEFHAAILTDEGLILVNINNHIFCFFLPHINLPPIVGIELSEIIPQLYFRCVIPLYPPSKWELILVSFQNPFIYLPRFYQ